MTTLYCYVDEFLIIIKITYLFLLRVESATQPTVIYKLANVRGIRSSQNNVFGILFLFFIIIIKKLKYTTV